MTPSRSRPPARSRRPGPRPRSRVSPPPRRPRPPPEAPEQTAPEPAQPTAPAPEQPAPAESAPSGGLGLVEVRRLWPDLLDAVKLKRRYTWILLSQNAQVAAVDDKTLTIALVNAGARNSFMSGGSEEILRQAAIDVIGQSWRIEAIVDPSAQPGADPASEPRVVRPAVQEQQPAPGRTSPPPRPDRRPRDAGRGRHPPGTAGSPPVPPPVDLARQPIDPSAIASAREAIQPTRAAGAVGPKGPSVSDTDAHPDDPDADDHGLGGAQLLERELGARIIEEIRHD